MDRKITSKTASNKTAAEIAKAGREGKVPLYHIMGKASAVKKNLTDFGESTGLRGIFESIDAETGETRRAPIYWPPAFLAEQIEAELLTLEGDDKAVIEFAYTVGVEPDDNGQLGYRYFIDEIRDPTASAEEADPFYNLREAVPAPAKQIENKSKSKKDAA